MPSKAKSSDNVQSTGKNTKKVVTEPVVIDQ